MSNGAHRHAPTPKTTRDGVHSSRLGTDTRPVKRDTGL